MTHPLTRWQVARTAFNKARRARRWRPEAAALAATTAAPVTPPEPDLFE